MIKKKKRKKKTIVQKESNFHKIEIMDKMVYSNHVCEWV